MKQIIFIFILLFTNIISGQINRDWKNMSKEEKKNKLKEMTPQQRSSLIAGFQQRMILEDLEIDPLKKEKFNTIFKEYKKSEKEIKENYKPSIHIETKNEIEAEKELEKSFEGAQKLLDLRKKYAEKLKEVISSQQILKLFENEGKMRLRMMQNRKTEGHSPPRN